MGPPCALCKGRNPPRTHVFPQNSRPEVQLKWVKAMDLPQEREDSILAEMREMEQKGSRPRWCTFHFEYDSAGIHNPKYFDPEEGKTAQGWKENEDGDEEEDEDEQGTTSKDDDARSLSSTPNEPRRSTRKRTTREPPPPPSPSSSSIIMDKSLHKILVDAGCIPGDDSDDISSASSSTTSKKEGAATTAEKTLQNILMEAGLPVPETLQAKTGLVVKGREPLIVAQPHRSAPMLSAAAAKAMKRNAQIADAKRVSAYGRPGGATLLNPRTLLNPMTAKLENGAWPKVIIPKIVGSGAQKPPTYCYNPNTSEKYDDADGLRNFKMPCQGDCRSELTVIMNRARILEDQFEDLSNSVHSLVKMYQTKDAIAYRPPQSLATIHGRAASVAGPVYGRSLPRKEAPNPLDSLAVQERRERRMGGNNKEPERLLTDDDLASTVRRRVSKQDQSEDEDDEDAPELDDDVKGDDDYRPRKKRLRTASARDADTSASEASPPMLELVELD